MSQSEIVVQFSRPDDHNQWVHLWVLSPRGDMRACVASVWGVPEVADTAGSLPVMVVVRYDSLIVAFFHCHRVTHDDPLQAMWAEEDRIEAAEPVTV